MSSYTNSHLSGGYYELGQVDPSSLQANRQGSDRTAQRSLSGDDSSPMMQSDSKIHRMPTVSHLSSSQEELRDNVSVRRPESKSKTEWRSWKLSWPANTVLLIIEAGFIATVLALNKLSERNGGIVTVPNIESTSSNITQISRPKLQQYYGLLWTSLPSLILSLYSIAWAAFVGASYERQPFIELRRGGNARRTIMLDYRAYPSLYSWAVAILNHHTHLGYAMLLTIVVPVVVVPLSAHLLVATTSNHASSVSIGFTSQYNDSIPTAKLNLESFMSLATAVNAYGTTPPAWMTTEYAFIPFYATSPTANLNKNSSTDLSATVDAYSAYLDCVVIDPALYNASLSGDTAQGSGMLSVRYSDRSCSVEQHITVGSNTPTYTMSSFSTCEGQAVNRLTMLSGMFSNSSSIGMTDFSVISCIPSYWHSTGVLTVVLKPGQKPAFVSFSQQTSQQINPEFTDVLEYNIHPYVVFDPSAFTISDIFGFSTLLTALAVTDQNMTAALASVTVKNAMERVFTTFFAAFASSQVLMPTATTTPGIGILTEPVNRLFVVGPIAYTMVVLLLLVTICHVVLWVYAVRHRSALNEEPIGLLGHAVVLQHGSVDNVVSQVKRHCGDNYEVRKGLKEKFTIDQSYCFWDETQGRIRIEGLNKKQE